MISLCAPASWPHKAKDTGQELYVYKNGLDDLANSSKPSAWLKPLGKTSPHKKKYTVPSTIWLVLFCISLMHTCG